MIAPCVPRPASSPPPAWWRAFVCRPSGRTASTKHTSATAALRSPVSYARRPRSRLGSPARLRRSGERRRLALAASRYLRRASLLLRAACVRSSPPGFTHARGNAAAFLPPLRQPAAARHRSRLSLSASGGAVPTQAGLLQANIAAMSIGVNRLPSSFALLGRGFTMPAVCANACHRPSIQRGSRLGFYRSPVTAMSSSHRLFVARFRSLPGETRLSKGFCPFPPPIRQ